jgi:hypothetical protein
MGTGVASFVRPGNFLTESIKTSNHTKSLEIRRRVEFAMLGNGFTPPEMRLRVEQKEGMP